MDYGCCNFAPKDEAQDPEDVPPLELHSELVKQVPLNPFEAPHGELGNRMTLNILSCFLKKIKKCIV